MMNEDNIPKIRRNGVINLQESTFRLPVRFPGYG